MPTKANTSLILFVLISLVYFIGEFLPSKSIIYATKPLLMIALMAYFYFATKEHPSSFRFWIIIGLLFSFGGDTLLMFVESDPKAQIFFLLGLASFLLAHLAYLFAFIKYPSTQKGFVKKRPIWVIPFLLLLIIFLTYLWPDLPGDFRIPVFLYACAIIAMALGSLNLKGKIADPIAQTILIGALLFVFSDAIIALNKFKTAQLSIPEPRLMIMIPYLVGQYLIAKGSAAANNTLIE